MFEVEQKFPVADLAEVAHRFSLRSARFDELEQHVDRYFRHPSRDFAVTDEALRIRRVGEANWFTYKGPKLDRTTKTRREVEVPLREGGEIAQNMTRVLESLGFAVVTEVRKERRRGTIAWQGRDVHISLDNVEKVGQFVELELLVDHDEVDAAKQCIASLAAAVELEASERRSYLELLLERI